MNHLSRRRASKLQLASDDLYRLQEEAADLKLFIDRCCYIPQQLGGWEKITLWPAQRDVADFLSKHLNIIILKARQLGLTWLCVFEALQLMLARKGVQVGVYSLREAEAVDMVRRMKCVYDRLPARWKMMARGIELDSGTYWRLGSGSSVRALSSETGDSYTFGAVYVDEADLVPDLGTLLRSAAPTTERGGMMRLISRSDKTRPVTEFKSIWRAARDGLSKYKGVFLPWHAAPDRNRDWYDRQVAEEKAKGKTMDFVYGQYPETPEQALAPGESDKRFPLEWIELRTATRPLVDPRHCPPIANLRVFHTPQRDVRYVIGGDPAEGNPTSDESAACVLDEHGCQVAELFGTRQPVVFAQAVAALARWYNRAAVLIERNNHGHAVLVALDGTGTDILTGLDANPGWLSNKKSKAIMYDDLAEDIQNSQVTIRSIQCSDQLQLIHGTDLCAPEGMHDDLATAYALAAEALRLASLGRPASSWTPDRKEITMSGPRQQATGPPHWQR